VFQNDFRCMGRAWPFAMFVLPPLPTTSMDPNIINERIILMTKGGEFRMVHLPSMEGLVTAQERLEMAKEKWCAERQWWLDQFRSHRYRRRHQQRQLDDEITPPLPVSPMNNNTTTTATTIPNAPPMTEEQQQQVRQDARHQTRTRRRLRRREAETKAWIELQEESNTSTNVTPRSTVDATSVTSSSSSSIASVVGDDQKRSSGVINQGDNLITSNGVTVMEPSTSASYLANNDSSSFPLHRYNSRSLFARNGRHRRYYQSRFNQDYGDPAAHIQFPDSVFDTKELTIQLKSRPTKKMNRGNGVFRSSIAILQYSPTTGRPLLITTPCHSTRRSLRQHRGDDAALSASLNLQFQVWIWDTNQPTWSLVRRLEVDPAVLYDIHVTKEDKQNGGRGYNGRRRNYDTDRAHGHILSDNRLAVLWPTTSSQTALFVVWSHLEANAAERYATWLLPETHNVEVNHRFVLIFHRSRSLSLSLFVLLLGVA
jgi:hypothetical protein